MHTRIFLSNSGPLALCPHEEKTFVDHDREGASWRFTNLPWALDKCKDGRWRFAHYVSLDGVALNVHFEKARATDELAQARQAREEGGGRRRGNCRKVDSSAWDDCARGPLSHLDFSRVPTKVQEEG
jgi:hypothetical protein